MPIWRRLHSLNHPGWCLFTATVGANPLDRRRMPFLLCQILLTHGKSRGKTSVRWERFSQMCHLFLTCCKLRQCPSQAVSIKLLCLSFSWLLLLVSVAWSIMFLVAIERHVTTSALLCSFLQSHLAICRYCPQPHVLEWLCEYLATHFG